MAEFKGLFFDGKTSAGQPVLIELLPGQILIAHTTYAEPIKRYWEVNKIAPNDFNDREMVVLEYDSALREYLEVKDPEFALALKKNYPYAAFARTRYGSLISGNPLPLIAVAAVFLMLVAATYFWVIPKVAELAAVNLPEVTEKQLGDALIGSMLEKEDVDSAKTVYAQKFFDHLQGNKQHKIIVTVVNNSQANAFAVPGGHVVVYEPIINLTDNYAEFAGLLAHENAHLQHRHSLKALFRNLSSYFLVSLLFGDVNGLMAIVIENADNLKSLEFTRELEKEADLTGLELLKKRRIDPNGMVALFSALKKEKAGFNLPEFLSTHPVLDSRIQYLKAEIKRQKFQTQTNDSLQYYYKKLKE